MYIWLSKLIFPQSGWVSIQKLYAHWNMKMDKGIKWKAVICYLNVYHIEWKDLEIVLYIVLCITWLSLPLSFRWGKNFPFSHRMIASSFTSSGVTFLSPSFSLTFIYCRGWQGLIAQGCHSSILIIDPKTSQTIQVLEKHKANVVKVSFLS